MAPSAVSRPHHPANLYTPSNIISAPAVTIAGLIYFSGIGAQMESRIEKRGPDPGGLRADRGLSVASPWYRHSLNGGVGGLWRPAL